MAQAFCHVCYGTSLTFENGVLVCDTCGTQAQAIQEETEFQAGIDDTRGKRRAAGPSAAWQQSQATLLAQEEAAAAQQLQDAALVYVRCLQRLLQAQAGALTSRYGVGPQASSVLRQLWLSLLPSTGLLEPSPAQPPAAAALSAAAAEAAAGASGAAASAAEGGQDMLGSEPVGPAGQQQQQQRSSVLVAPKNMKQLFWKLLHPQVTLQLCYLACLLLREAVTHHDVIAWALDGTLPFLDLPDLASTHIPEAQLSTLPVRLLQPEVALSPSAFLNASLTLAEQMGLGVPPINAGALLLRVVRELALPQVVLDLGQVLVSMYLVGSHRLRPTAVLRSGQVAPYVWLAAVVVVAVKLLWGLGSTEGLVQPVVRVDDPPGGWQAWAEGVAGSLVGLSHMSLSEEEVLALGPEARRIYLQYCRAIMFAGQPTVPTLDELRNTLLGWYDASSGAPGQQVGRLQTPTHQQRPAATVAGQGGQAGGSEAPEGNAPSPSPAQPQQQQQQQQSVGGPWVGGGGESDGSSFYCLTTGVAAAGGGGGGTYRLEPALAAVVFVVAGHAGCSPAALLDCVKVLEKQLVAAEAGAKILQQLQAAVL